MLIILTALLTLTALSAHFTLKPPASVVTVPFRMFLQMTLTIQVIAVPIIAAAYAGFSFLMRHKRPMGKISAICVAVLMVGFILNLITLISIQSSVSEKSGIEYQAIGAGENRGQYELSLTADLSKELGMEQCSVFSDESSPYRGVALIYLNYGGWSVQDTSFGEQIKDFCRKEGYTFVRFGAKCGKGKNIPKLAACINENLVRLREKLDFDNIILCGGSAGGHLALLCGEKGDADFPLAEIKADGVIALYPCVDPAGTYDFFVSADGNGLLDGLGNSIYCGMYGGKSGTLAGETKSLDEAVFGVRGESNSYYETTAIRNCLDNDVPFLIVHGEKDSMVPIEFSNELIEEVKAKGKCGALLTLYGTEHVFDLMKTAAWDRCEREMAGFVREIISSSSYFV